LYPLAACLLLLFVCVCICPRLRTRAFCRFFLIKCILIYEPLIWTTMRYSMRAWSPCYAKWRPSVVLGTRMRKNLCPDYCTTMSNFLTLGPWENVKFLIFPHPREGKQSQIPWVCPPLGLNIDKCIIIQQMLNYPASQAENVLGLAFL
jgi:hypothetical protein